MGYVGLPLACLASEKGWKTFGIVRNPEKAEAINRKASPVQEPGLSRWLRRTNVHATTDYRVIKQCSIVVICVPTPVDEHYNPDFRPLRQAVRSVAKYLRRGHTIILESTVNPGVCEEVMVPLLEASGLKARKDFTLAHCPERIDPGNRKWTVRNIPRVLGAIDAKGIERAERFYHSILEGSLRRMKSIRDAEAVKVLENAFRDVNIAFVNEVAKSFVRLGIDTLDVIEGAKTKPFAFLAHYPSAGVGGHCIPVDPYYLIERAKRSGFNHEFLKLAREINNSMPAYTVSLLIQALNERAKAIRGTRIGILGVAYKANVADTRESPSYHVVKILRDEYHASVEVFDPYVPHSSTVATLKELLEKCSALILMTDHKEFMEMTPRHLRRHGIIAFVDGKNAFDRNAMIKHGITYRGIGR